MPSVHTTLKIHDEYNDMFEGIGCFKGTFSLQIKQNAKPYQALLRCAAYVLEEQFKKETERLQQHKILAPLCLEEMAQWCNSFATVPKPNSTIHLCLDPTKLNQAHTGLNRGPALNDNTPQANKCVLCDHNQCKFRIKKISYLTTSTYQFGRYRLTRLPFGIMPAGNMFQQKIDEIFKYLLNVLGTADDILFVGYDSNGREHK